MVELTFREGVKLRKSLRSAFRSRSALAQVVFDHLREDLGQIAENVDYGEVLIKLIVWAEANGRTGDLIRGACDRQSRRRFAERVRGRISGAAPQRRRRPRLPPRVLAQPMRQQLVAAVLRIPSSDSYDGRSAFLVGLPASPSRNQGNAVSRPRYDLRSTRRVRAAGFGPMAPAPGHRQYHGLHPGVSGGPRCD